MKISEFSEGKLRFSQANSLTARSETSLPLNSMAGFGAILHEAKGQAQYNTIHCYADESSINVLYLPCPRIAISTLILMLSRSFQNCGQYHRHE
jgi:hypothetical protein